MWQQAQSEKPQVGEVETARVAVEVAEAAVESHIQLLTGSELALQGEFTQLAGRVEDLGAEICETCQECECKVEDMLFERNGGQGRLDLTVHSSQALVNQ